MDRPEMLLLSRIDFRKRIAVAARLGWCSLAATGEVRERVGIAISQPVILYQPGADLAMLELA
jgi:hypothetical protein